MARDDDDFLAPHKSAIVKHVIGESLDAFSIAELSDRISLMRTEIDRIEATMVRKHASREAAATFFKNKPGR